MRGGERLQQLVAVGAAPLAVIEVAEERDVTTCHGDSLLTLGP
jgi:hypothetical protein